MQMLHLPSNMIATRMQQARIRHLVDHRQPAASASYPPSTSGRLTAISSSYHSSSYLSLPVFSGMLGGCHLYCGSKGAA